MPQVLTQEQAAQKHMRAHVVDQRAIRLRGKWPFKVECIYREKGRGANMPENAGSSLATES